MLYILIFIICLAGFGNNQLYPLKMCIFNEIRPQPFISKQNNFWSSTKNNIKIYLTLRISSKPGVKVEDIYTKASKLKHFSNKVKAAVL